MAKVKGMKVVLRVEDRAEHTVTSRKETKENNPATNKDCVGNVKSVFQSVRHHCKPRSPLSDSSSTVVQEGNESDATDPDMSKLKTDVPGEMKPYSDSREKKTETTCICCGTREQASAQLQQKERTTHTSARPAPDIKVSVTKSQSRAARKPGVKQTENKVPQNKKVTDYYPIRRSNRKTKSELKNEEYRQIDNVIKSGIEEGMQVKHMEGKGRGIFAVKGFKKGDFVVEYHGDLLELSEAKIREAQYAEEPRTGCYMYYFQYQSKTYCVDATKETTRLGRLINHSKSGNCQTKLHPIDGTPHLILVASRDIKAEEELLYDYGDRSKASVMAHPWLK